MDPPTGVGVGRLQWRPQKDWGNRAGMRGRDSMGTPSQRMVTHAWSSNTRLNMLCVVPWIPLQEGMQSSQPSPSPPPPPERHHSEAAHFRSTNRNVVRGAVQKRRGSGVCASVPHPLTSSE